MGLGIIFVIGGLIIVIGMYVWTRQRQELGAASVAEQQIVNTLPVASSDDAILVSREHGQLVYINERARHWLGLNGGDPNLEYIARQAQPTDSFLELFAGEGQASFQLGKRWVEASSHTIPAAGEQRTVVVLRELSASTASPDALDLALAVNTINEIGETVNVSLSMEQVLQALLAIVRKAIPADAGEICLFDAEHGTLSPRGWVGDSNYLVALLESGGYYHIGEGITGWIAQHRRPMLVNNTRDMSSVQPKLSGFFETYIGVPLALNDRFIGTLELARGQTVRFNQSDLALLQAISKQVAISIYNAELYAQQSSRINDMASLQEIARQPDAISDTRPIYHALNERIAKLVGASQCGILLYDENRRALVPEMPFYGLPDALVRSIVISLPADSPQRDIWEKSEYWLTNDAPDEPLIEALGLAGAFSAAGIRNSILIPLEIGNRRIGMMQLSNKRAEGGFTSQDITDLRLLSAQAAVVVENLRLFLRDQRQGIELTGLQEITHVIGALNQEGEFYSSLTERIARLMEIQMCGILLYDEETHSLRSRLPFYGLADDQIRDYHIDLKPGSPLDSIWQEEDFWYTNSTASSAVVYEAGLAEFAAFVGVTKTLFAVLSVGGRRLGVVQVSNKRDGSDFSDKDARILLIFATQTAALIENARLYQEMQRGADEATALRQVAELAGKIITSEDSFTPVLEEISRLTNSPLVYINILDPQTGSLIAYPRYVFGAEISDPVIYDIYSKDFEYSVAVSHRAFISNDVLHDPRVLDSYRSTSRRFGITKAVVVPLIVGDRNLGELGISNRPDVPYNEEDERLLSAVAAQIAATIERLRLYEAAGENLSRRLQELDAISRISNELTQTLELDPVLDAIRHEAAKATRAEGSTIALLRPAALWKDGNVPEMDRRLGDQVILTTITDIEVEAVQRGADTVLISDYRTSEMRAMPEAARSAIAAAFLFEDEIVGVLHLYHSRPNHFDERAAAFLLTLAAKASLGYGNNKRYREQLERSTRLRRRVDQLNQIFELGQMLQSNVDHVTMLEAIVYSIQQSVGFDTCVALLADDGAGVLRRVAQAGIPLDAFEQSKADVMPLATFGDLAQDRYRISESYFFPVDQADSWQAGDLLALSTDYEGKRRPPVSNDPKAWRDGDMLLVPLNGAGGELLGVISLDVPQDNSRPDRTTVEILEIFAHQASTTIENMRLYLASLQNAEQEARLNAMMEAIASTLDTTAIVEAVADSSLRVLPFAQMTVVVQDVEGQGYDVIRVNVHLDGSLRITHEHRVHLDNTALGRSMADGQDYLYYSDAPEAEEYEDLRSWQQRGERTTLVVPLLAGGERLGAMHLGSDLEHAYGFNEYRPLIQRMANLAAVAMQNARLFNQALNLKTFNESVVESIQQGIVVLDKSGLILSVNDFIRQKYSWEPAEALRQDLFAYRPNLAPFLAQDVTAVLATGEPHEKIGQRSVTDDGKLLVRNFYTYPLRSGDSIRGAVVLVEDVTERALLEQDVETRANQLAVLTEVSSRITATLNRNDVINLALDEMGRVIQYDTMTLWSRSGDWLNLEGSSGGFDEEVVMVSDEDSRIRIDSHERLKMLVESQRPYTISQLQGWDRLPGEIEAKSWLGVPLVNQGNVVGVISLAKHEPRFYDAQAEQAAFAFANQVAIALANAHLYTQAEYRNERLSLLNRVSVSLAQSLDSENILETGLLEIARALGIGYGRALVFERELNLARVVVKYPRGDVPPDEVISLTDSAILRSIRRTASPLIYENIPALPYEDPIARELRDRQLVAYVAIPMTVGGQVIGSFELEGFESPRRFDPDQIELGLIIANQAAIAVQNTNLLEQTLVRTRELETLLEAAQATSLTLNLESAYRSVVELILHALEMDSCAIMIWDNVEGVLEVQHQMDRYGESTMDYGTKYNLRQYPARLKALENREIIVVRADKPDADAAELEELRAQNMHLRVLVPLVVRDQSIGMVQAELATPHRAFGNREVRLAQALGSQAAIAIQNARLSTETAALVEEGFLINNLSQAISSKLDIEDMIDIVRDQVPSVTDAPEIYLALYDAKTHHITFPMAVKNGEDFEIPPRELGTDEVSFIIKHRRSLVLGGGNFSSDEMRRNLGITNGEGEARSYLGVPVQAGDQILGVLAVRDERNARAFGINDERLLTTVGTQLGAAIQNARLFQQISNFAEELNQRVRERTDELQKERDRIDTLYRITSELARTLDMDRIIRRGLEMVASAVAADDGAILLIDPLSDRLFTRSSLRKTLPEGAVHPAERLAAWLLQNEQSVFVPDLRQNEHWDVNAPGAEDFRSALAVVLESGDDPQGVLVLLSRHTSVFTETQLKLVIAAATQVASAINNADLYHLIRDQAERLGMLLRTEQEEAEKNSAIVEGIADGVMLADSDGVVIQFNSAAERILDLPRDNIIGQPLFKLTGIFGGSASKWAKAVQDWATNPEQFPEGEFLDETLDLGTRVVNIHLSPVHIGDRYLGTVSVFRDITKDVEVDRIKSQFIANVTHELRTPMTPLKGFTDLLLMGAVGPLSEQQRGLVSKIKTNADRLGRLLEDLLNISKLDAGESRPNFGPVDVTEVLDNAVDKLKSRPDFDRKELTITMDIQPALQPIAADEDKLTQIVSNIVDNAFNYTPAGGSITVGAHEDAGHVIIAVKDTGIGIPEEFQARIWERFERYEDAALVMDVPGTGLGLSIVKTLVEMHNGNIWFESELDKGTTFYVSLPIEQPTG
jgi:PAS domain S-box-containing protein